ncbi:ribonuclease Z [Bacteroidota bacterium]
MSFELIVLGSSSALPTSKRNTAAHLLNVNERFFLIDCGEGTQIQLRKNNLSPLRINHIFISHLHGDHVFGLFGLLSSMRLLGREVPMNLYGPPMLEDMMRTHFSYFGDPPFQLTFHAVNDRELVYEDKWIRVIALSLKHRTETYGYLFKEKPRLLNVVKEKIEQYGLGIAAIKKIKEGEDFTTDSGTVIPNRELTLPPVVQRSYAYLSDTAYVPEIAEELDGVDLLFHEATFLQKDEALARDTFHSTALQAAQMAKLCNAKTLLIGHFSTRYKDEKILENEARTVFPNTRVVNDGDRYSVAEQRIAE